MTTNPRILVIDDQQSILDLLQMILEAETDFDVKMTTDARQWATLLERSPAELLLVDYRMPFMSGEELIRAVRHSKYSAQIKGIALFSATPFTLSDVQRMGADIFFEKPFDVDNLVTGLKGLLKPRRLFLPCRTGTICPVAKIRNKPGTKRSIV